MACGRSGARLNALDTKRKLSLARIYTLVAIAQMVHEVKWNDKMNEDTTQP